MLGLQSLGELRPSYCSVVVAQRALWDASGDRPTLWSPLLATSICRSPSIPGCGTVDASARGTDSYELPGETQRARPAGFLFLKI